ncbi:MAG: prepilin-type N-terminal cleavage/methylation domain-containing protein [Clostridia bacterium]
MKRTERNKGFTMIEIITVLVILVLLAAISIPNVKNYIERSEQSARNNVARTLFLVAQTALTRADSAGKHIAAPIIADLSCIQPKLNDTELAKQGKLCYLARAQGEQTDGTVLYGLLEPYMSDKAVLKNAILVEFNRETGKVLSVFYSEKIKTLGYSGGYNVSNRDVSSLGKGFVGYYGVDSTGEKINAPISDQIDIRLMDYGVDSVVGGINRGACYGLLTAECTLPPLDQRGFKDRYTLTLEPQNGLVEKIMISDDPTAGAELKLADLLKITSLDNAMQNPIMRANGRRLAVYTERRLTSDVLVFVLDCVQSAGASENLSIRKTFPGIGCGYLYAAFAISDGVDTYTVDAPNSVHALFSAKPDPDVERYEIKSVRHLNNIRHYNLPNTIYQQIQPIQMVNYQGTTLNFAPLCNRNDRAPGVTTDGFMGKYVNDTAASMTDTNAIIDLQITDADNAGLFDTIAQGGSVVGVRLAYSSDPGRNSAIRGKRFAGGIAAINNGSISDCTVFGGVKSTSPSSGIAGGIAGQNDGNIAMCYVASDVSGGQFAGGIAGTCSGVIAYCEVGTAARITNGVRGLFGTNPYYGARMRTSDWVYAPNGNPYGSSNNTYIISSTDSGGAAGGIVGNIDTAFQSGIVGCVNAAQVEASSGGASGGIAGVIDPILAGSAMNEPAVLATSYNAGAVYGSGAVGGAVGLLQNGRIQTCYNTGFINRTIDAGKDAITIGLRTFWEPGTPRNLGNSINTTGGIVGKGGRNTAIINCYNMQFSGDVYGGAFGVLDQKAVVKNCAFLGNVLNTVQEYHVTGSKTSIQGLIRASSSDLRNAATKLFVDNTFSYGKIPGIGSFQYVFPYLNNDKNGFCGLGASFHRTPWNRPIEEYGSVKLMQSSTNSNEVTLTFRLLEPGGGTLKLIAAPISGSTTTITIPISTQMLLDLQANKQKVLMGTDSNGTPYSFQCAGAAISNSSSDGKNQREMGYAFVYTLTLHWTGSNDGMPAGTNNIAAELWVTNHKCIDTDQLSKTLVVPGSVWLGSGQLPYEAQSLAFSYIKVSMTPLSPMVLTLKYEDTAIPDQMISIVQNDIKNSDQSLADAVKNNHWVSLLGGTGKYYYYTSGNDFYIMLYKDAGNPNPDFPSASNGLVAGGTFHVEVKLGVDPNTTYTTGNQKLKVP